MIKHIFVLITLLVLLINIIPLCTAEDDSDGDGIPDYWENFYGLNPNDASDATGDIDHDGLSNIREYNNGIDSTNLSNPFSGGRVKAAWTGCYPYPGEMTSEKVTELMNAGINTFIINDFAPYVPYQNLSSDPSVFDLIGPDPNAPYIIPYYWNGYPYNARITIKEKAALVKQDGFAYFQTLAFDYNAFPNSNYVIPNAYPVVYSDGTSGSQISPFCPAYWQWLTKMVRSLAHLPIHYPNLYRIDGVLFDFELYGQEELHRDTYFDETWGFENQTFDAYCHDRGYDTLYGWNSNTIPAAQRFNLLVQNHLITNVSNGYHQGDYYLYLSSLIKEYATTMREQVKEINPDFLIGAYPSPPKTPTGPSSTHRYYLAEIFSGWSTRTQPAVVWGTDMYGGGGADNIPPGLSENKTAQGYYNLTTIFPSMISPGNEIYAYYVGGVSTRCYFSGNWGYNLYNIATKTNGYWIFTTTEFTGDLKNLTGDYSIPYFDRLNNTVYLAIYNSSDTPCNTQEIYETGVQDYYHEMDVMNSELTQYFENYPGYPTFLTKISPPLAPTIFYEYPQHISIPNSTIIPLGQKNDSILELPESKIRFEGDHNFVFYATKNQTVHMNVSSYLWTYISDVNAGITYEVLDTEGNEIIRGVLPRPVDPCYSGYTAIPGSISFTAPATGKYFLLIDPKVVSCFEINSTNVPLSLYKPYREPTAQAPLDDNDYIHIVDMYSDWLNRVYTLYFWVKDDVTMFSVHIKTKASYNGGFHAAISKPTEQGYEIIATNDTASTNKSVFLNITVSPDETKHIWKLVISKPLDGQQVLGDIYVRFDNTIDPYFSFTNDSRYFMIENHPPIAEEDVFTVNQGSANNLLDVVANDHDSEQDVLQMLDLIQPLHGVANIENNKVLYAPTSGFNGDDTFTYQVTDGWNVSNWTQVTVHVSTQYYGGGEGYQGSGGDSSTKENKNNSQENVSGNSSAGNTSGDGGNESDISDDLSGDNSSDNTNSSINSDDDYTGMLNLGSDADNHAFTLEQEKVTLLFSFIGISVGCGIILCSIIILKRRIPRKSTSIDISSESIDEISSLLVLAQQNSWNPKLAGRYYYQARAQFLERSKAITRKQYKIVQKQLLETYTRL